MGTPSSPASSRCDASRLRIGLTGGIGSGKSLVADEFARLGAQVIDSDAIAHAITSPGGCAIAAIRDEFGPAVITAEGALDRAQMRQLAFRDPVVRQRLESILHPMIRTEADRLAAGATATQPFAVFVVPLLVESGNWRERVQRVLVIDCTPQTQVKRVMRRSGLDASTVTAIIAAQAQRARRLDAADDILVNEGDADQTLDRTRRLHALYCGLARCAGAL